MSGPAPRREAITKGPSRAQLSAVRQITAAGAVVLRAREGRQPHLLLVHRPAYDDWTLPKGKLDPNEYLPAAAVRETWEETAVTVRLGVPVNRIDYPVGGGHKTVYYWRAGVRTHGRHKATAEIDRIAWLPLAAALKRMTYADEKALVEQGTSQPDTTPLLIVRHGKAIDRKDWSGKDQLRGLSERGRLQSSLLIPLLDAYGVARLASSSSTRCMDTLAPYAKARRVELQGWATLSEELAEKNTGGVTGLMQRLITRTVARGEPLAVCGHRPVLPLMLEALGIPDRPMVTGAVAVAHLSAAGETVAVEWHQPKA